MRNTFAISACHHKPLENMSRKYGMTEEDKKQNKRIQVHVAPVLELEIEENILYNPSKEFYISELFGLG